MGLDYSFLLKKVKNNLNVEAQKFKFALINLEYTIIMRYQPHEDMDRNIPFPTLTQTDFIVHITFSMFVLRFHKASLNRETSVSVFKMYDSAANPT